MALIVLNVNLCIIKNLEKYTTKSYSFFVNIFYGSNLKLNLFQLKINYTL